MRKIHKASRVTRRHNRNKFEAKFKAINLFLLLITVAVCATGIKVCASETTGVVKVHITTINTPNTEVEAIPEQDANIVLLPEEDVLDTLSEDELYYLAECVEIEACGEGLEGKKAVASVLTNRVNSASFPDSYQGVVTQKLGSTPQFSSYTSSVWGKKEITEETYTAIREVLQDGSNVEDATYFANLNIVKSGWFYTAQANGTLISVAVVGNHSFFRTAE